MMTIRTVAIIVGSWFFLSWLIWAIEFYHMYWYGKKRGIPIHKLHSFSPGPINQAYRAWGKTNGVDVTWRLRFRTGCFINLIVSNAVFLVFCLNFLPNPPAPALPGETFPHP
ncbi:MAG: hypothetical protein KC592_12435 [Nitrospira sp.]|nr:hypothetical protein [Nitrospira sp.]